MGRAKGARVFGRWRPGNAPGRKRCPRWLVGDQRRDHLDEVAEADILADADCRWCRAPGPRRRRRRCRAASCPSSCGSRSRSRSTDRSLPARPRAWPPGDRALASWPIRYCRWRARTERSCCCCLRGARAGAPAPSTASAVRMYFVSRRATRRLISHRVITRKRSTKVYKRSSVSPLSVGVGCARPHAEALGQGYGKRVESWERGLRRVFEIETCARNLVRYGAAHSEKKSKSESPLAADVLLPSPRVQERGEQGRRTVLLSFASAVPG